METTLLLLIFILVLAVFLGLELVSQIPDSQHISFLSGSNALAGIIVLGAIIVAGNAGNFSALIGGFAVALAAFKVTAGFALTNRMPDPEEKNTEK